MVFLGIESSTEVSSVALIDEYCVIGEITYKIKKSHSTQLMPMVIQLLEVSGYSLRTIDGIGVSVGPGSFTGMRIGITLANMLSYANNLPIVGISSLKAIAYNGKGLADYLCPLICSRKEEVYTALFNSKLNLLINEQVTPIKSFINNLPKEPILFLGDGFIRHNLFFHKKKVPLINCNPEIGTPKGSSVAFLAMKSFKNGKIDNHFTLKPDYFRPIEAETQWNQKYGM